MSHEYDLLSIHDFIFNKILPKFGSYDRKQLLSKYFDSSNYLCSYYENLINFFKEVEWKIDSSIRNEFKSKMSLCYYNIGMIDYNDENYSDSIDKFNDCINNYYITSEYRKKSREKISKGYYFLGKEQYDNNDFYEAERYLSNSTDYFSDSSIENYFKTKIKNLLSETYKKIGEKKWNKNNEYDMKDSIEYYIKALDKSSGNESNKISNIIHNLNEYYYLYKAYNSSGSSRRDYLYSSYNSNSGYSSKIYSLYQRQCNILRTEEESSNINSRNYSLNSEINNIKYQISNQETYNKRQSEYNKTMKLNVNGLIDKMNQLNTDMNNIIGQTIKDSGDVIQTQKDTKEKIDSNIEKQEKFLEELEKIEKEKQKNIKEKKEVNRNLKEQNEQYIIILKNFEEKLNKRLLNN